MLEASKITLHETFFKNSLVATALSRYASIQMAHPCSRNQSAGFGIVATANLPLLILFFLSDTFFPLSHSPIITSSILLSPMQLDIQDCTVTQVVVTDVGVGILSGLVFCAAATYLLLNVEEFWKD
jgi:hypothetical protein